MSLSQLTSSAADFLVNHTASPENAKPAPTPVTSGASTPESFAKLGPDGCWLRTCQGYCQVNLDGSLDEFSGTWPRSATVSSGTAYRRQPLVPLTSAIGSGLWPTPAAHEPGWRNIEVVDKDGNPPAYANQRFYDKQTGRLVQKGLSQVVKMWPTPTQRDAMGGPGCSGRDGGMNLRTSVAMWRTPSATLIEPKSNVTKLTGRKPTDPQVGLADQVGGQLNPTWVEWLMGFPLGWTDLDASVTP